MSRRLLLAVLLVGVGLLAFAAPATAVEVAPDRAIVELNLARDGVNASVDLYGRGLAEDAYTAARNAYLDHFEYVEIPLRLRDEGLTLDLEERFALLRDHIRAGAPASQVSADAAAVHEGLDRVERALSSPGVAAPLIAAGYAFIILFREGLEATLVVATVLGYIAASRNDAYRKPVLQGVLAGLATTVVAFVALSALLRLAPAQRELIEAVTLIIAVGVLFWVSFWLVSRLDQRRWMEFVRARVSTAVATGSAVALFGVGFTAVFREGLETALFYQALLTFAEGLEIWVLAGSLASAAVLAVLAYLILRAGRRLPIKAFLSTAVVLLMVLSVAFMGNAVRALQESGWVPVSVIYSLPRLPVFLAELTGWYPTLETLTFQAILVAVYLLGAAWVFVIAPRRRAVGGAGAVGLRSPEAPTRAD